MSVTDPTVTRTDEHGHVTIEWPDPPRRSYEVAHEVIAEFVALLNAVADLRERFDVVDVITFDEFVETMSSSVWSPVHPPAPRVAPAGVEGAGSSRPWSSGIPTALPPQVEEGGGCSVPQGIDAGRTCDPFRPPAALLPTLRERT